MSKRYHSVGLRLTDEEYDLLQRQALQRRWTMASLARFIVVAQLAQFEASERGADQVPELPFPVSREPAQPDVTKE